MKTWLKNEWHFLTSNYTEDKDLIFELWTEIEHQYSSKGRHYHNLSHIYHMLKQAESIKHSILDYDNFRYAIWYHDIIYKPTSKSNETKSAELAKKRLKQFKIDKNRLKTIENLIISTQKHEVIIGSNKDNAYLLDIDLSILGSNWKVYENYISLIRQEYAIYPDFLYNKGRKKAMLKFLNRKHIFFSDDYFHNYEVQARENIKKELENY